MRPHRTVVRLGLAATFAASPYLPAWAERIVVASGSEDLQSILERASDGDIVSLQSGDHRGPVRLNKRLVLEGAPGAVLTGPGSGSVVTISAPQAVVRGLTIRGSGTNGETLDSGVFVEKTASRALVVGNRIEGNLYGIYLHGAEGAIALGNTIVGIKEGRVNEAGNGISVWNATGAKVLDNDVSFGRDGIFSIASKHNVFNGNRFRELRFAIHYMYTNDSEIADNISTGNTVGFAIMFSHRLKVSRNISDGDRDHGFLFNYANGSQIFGNAVFGRLQPPERWMTSGMRTGEAREHGLPDAGDIESARATGWRSGPGKCVFIYNANRNRFRDNWFEGCEIGIHFTAGSEGNEIAGNAFVKNQNQVKYVGTRYLDWSKGGRGNFWSDNPTFDLNGDGLGDSAYRPNDLMDKVLWTVPQAKVLANSPAVQVIRWAQSQFPALLPGGVVDSHPLMLPPARPKIAERNRP
ncbi:nitrous oxide reductase family maturation protein NosD [Bosea sp. (in: a-proteobacteria)]|uniref:nitrous oxide reductase family maturation protein NosD n=1 Tax=Bosea sp. (in: a-proteobacteria) TaxID=1871050 RepID=UPI00260443B0|nr:nitrous oxide reductase family maturation protein NosD [Bosea sp. (in: a-proteobacteria)]MCO5091756.1 nitrous oxide reductase family maturation protein NosD [Bosea sp. (in: a-proteobacteria)]